MKPVDQESSVTLFLVQLKNWNRVNATFSLPFYELSYMIHTLYQLRGCLKESESEVAQLCPTLCNPVDCSPPGSSVHRFSGKNTGVGCHCQVLLIYLLITKYEVRASV